MDDPGVATVVVTGADGSEMPVLPGMLEETAAETAVAVVAAAIADLLITVATISSWTLISFELFGGGAGGCTVVVVVVAAVELDVNAGGLLGR